MYSGITPTCDRGFIKKLKEFDPTLRVIFDRDIERFVIQQPRRLGGWAIACVVRSLEDKQFAYPDDRHIQILYEADFQRKTVEKRIDEGEDYMINYQAEQDKRDRQEIHERTVDDKIQLMAALRKQYNLGKGVTAFRHITPKSKGYTVKDRRKLQTST